MSTGARDTMLSGAFSSVTSLPKSSITVTGKASVSAKTVAPDTQTAPNKAVAAANNVAFFILENSSCRFILFLSAYLLLYLI